MDKDLNLTNCATEIQVAAQAFIMANMVTMTTNNFKEQLQHQCQRKSNVQKDKWVIYISSKPLTAAHESLLSHGTNFTVVPRGPP